MIIDRVRIKGFRNYQDEEIKFARETLIIGPNDVGKSNLLYAIRLLLDRSLSEKDLDLSNVDYNIYTKSKVIKITLYLDKINEDCLKSIFKGCLKDEKVVLQYIKEKGKEYKIMCGPTEDLLSEQNTRFYLKRLNLEYVYSNRDLLGYIKRTRLELLQNAKDNQDEADQLKDKKTIKSLQKRLEDINANVDSLNFVKASLECVNKELRGIIANGEDTEVKFTTGDRDVEELLDNLSLSYGIDEGNMRIGGDGRNNQIYLASWIAKQKIQDTNERITLFAIEEPEAHLHPHQQRKLSKYLSSSFHEQILITTHSPQIATDFMPDKMVSLYKVNNITKAAQGGCCAKLKYDFNDFSYRLNSISAELFFSSGVFLVEGPSERIFFSALANALDIDLDRNNINIISVDGIGFKPYIKICKALNIPYILRTDNDIKSKQIEKKDFNYYSGITRAIGIYEKLIKKGKKEDLYIEWRKRKEENDWELADSVHKKADDLNKDIRNKLKVYHIYLSDKDLETDLAKSDLYKYLKAYYSSSNVNDTVDKMKQKKAENMVDFLCSMYSKGYSLSIIKKDKLCEPLNDLLNLSRKVIYGK